MQVEDVVDSISLRAYLEQFPLEHSLLTSQRLAFNFLMQVAPEVILSNLKETGGTDNGFELLPIFGSLLVASIGAERRQRTLAEDSIFAVMRAATAMGVRANPISDRVYDLIVAGALIDTDRKNNAYAANVAARVSRIISGRHIDMEDVRRFLTLLAQDTVAYYLPIELDEATLENWTNACKLLKVDREANWNFWTSWVDRVLAGRDTHTEALVSAIEGVTESDWVGNSARLKKRFDEVLAIYQAEDSRGNQSDPSKASYFDFVEINREMRAVAFSSDYEAFPDEASKSAFMSAAHDIRLVFDDWCELARAQLQGRNRPVTAVVATEQILDQLNALERGEAVSLRNLVRLGSNVKRLARDKELPVDLGSSVFEMFDEALEDYGQLVSAHLGGALQALMALRSLELGDLDSAECIVSLKGGLAYIQTLPNDVLLPFDAKSRAIIDHMVSDLEDEQSEIEEASTEVARQTRAKRFAEKFGGVSATIREYLLKGQMAAEKGGESVDKAGKWHKRWQTLGKIKEFWDNLPFGDGL
ncbi:MAG: hypothetical protein ABJO29_12885 [Yoonia sp.]|uniref:hypothetical protein n=1 Tax=Yoonia sp. TaxID=2212373 RepID=UPI0032674E55